MDFTDQHSASATKGAVHGALLSIATLCAVYNACAWKKRGGLHLKVNFILYSALIGFEMWQIHQHAKEMEEEYDSRPTR